MPAAGPQPMRRARPGLRRLVLAAGAVLLALAAAAPAFAVWMMPPPGFRAKDFAFIKRDALYHIFYTRTNTLDPNGNTENSFGHSVSNDLYTWTRLDSVLPVRPGEWDNHRVWAPHIVESEGVYYMFYTGVTNAPPAFSFYQRTGLATSTDLMSWNRHEVPVFSCEQAPWIHCDSTTSMGGNLRDPFVMKDPANPGQWLQYNSTVPDIDINRYVVGVATSAGDLATWADLKPLWATYHASTGFELAESSHLFARDGLWYLFFTTNGPQPLAWATGTDPIGEPPTWTQRGTVMSSVGFDTRFWFASEHLREGTHDYFAFVNFDRVDVREMQWRPDGTFALTQPDMFHVTFLGWDRDSVVQGNQAELIIRSVNGIGRWLKLELTKLTGTSGEETIPNAAVELPDSVYITDSLNVVSWAARRWMGPGDTDTSVTRLRVRTSDQTMAAQVLYVGPPGFCGSGGDDPGGELIDPGFRTQPQPPLGRATFRTLTRAPVGGGLALLVDLESAQHARVDVFDVQGRRLGTLADRELPSGASVLAFDPAQLGGRLRPGVYLARLATSRETKWTRVVITR
jgi:hypothetical protein